MAREILIVDDEADIRRLIADVLMDEGYATRLVGDSTSCLTALKQRQPSLLLLDVWLQGSQLDGLQLLEQVKLSHPDLPIVMISGHGTIEMAVQAIRKGAFDFIEKPFKTERLLVAVARAIETARLKRENAELRLRAGHSLDLDGLSPTIHTVRQTISRVAPTGSRVLISGPPGCGKEVAARLIHAQSRRADGPFIIVNCATMQPDALEAELFGQEMQDGRRKVGLLEQAHGGTLVLDEVGDMPMDTQAKFVRVLQEQGFERLSGSTRVEVDVRVVATTNRDLSAEMTAGRFRQDLFYRLNVVPLRIPGLNERREDIPALAQQFMRQASDASGAPARPFGEDSLAALQAYDWPGNVRQLRNVIDWLLIMGGEEDQPIRTDMLPPEIAGASPAVLRWERGAEIMTLPLRQAREMFEREYLLAQINRFGGNISRTSSFVGMERSALHRKLKLLGVQGDRNEKISAE